MGSTAQNVPRDAGGTVLPLTPSVLAIAVTYDATISTSTTVTLAATTTLIEVSALAQGIFMKWGATASSTAFDEFIQAGATRHYVVPLQTSGARYTTVQFIEEAASGRLVVIEK